MIEWLSEYWYLLIVLAVAVVVAVFAVFKAAKAYRKRMKLFRQEEENIKRLVALKEKFRPITKEAIDSASDGELLEGIALAYQLKLQKIEKQEEAFNLLNDDVKDIYTLDVFVQDKTSKEFFSQNGEILRSRILKALEKIGMDDFAHRLRPIYDMYDVNNEKVSYDPKKIADFDSYMEKEDVTDTIRLKAAEYIRRNFECFEN